MQGAQLPYCKEALARQYDQRQAAGDPPSSICCPATAAPPVAVDIAQIDSARDYALRIRSR